jgi:hypothetical protein
MGWGRMGWGWMRWGGGCGAKGDGCGGGRGSDEGGGGGDEMILYYRLMIKWSGLGDSTELSRMGLSQ